MMQYLFAIGHTQISSIFLLIYGKTILSKLKDRIDIVNFLYLSHINYNCFFCALFNKNLI